MLSDEVPAMVPRSGASAANASGPSSIFKSSQVKFILGRYFYKHYNASS